MKEYVELNKGTLRHSFEKKTDQFNQPPLPVALLDRFKYLIAVGFVTYLVFRLLDSEATIKGPEQRKISHGAGYVNKITPV